MYVSWMPESDHKRGYNFWMNGTSLNLVALPFYSSYKIIYPHNLNGELKPYETVVSFTWLKFHFTGITTVQCLRPR